MVFFCGLIIYGYIWVFAPLRKLHQGALRVAQGDFNYRMSFTRQDEMKELAEAFNSIDGPASRETFAATWMARSATEQPVGSLRAAGGNRVSGRGSGPQINNPLSAIMMAAESLDGDLLDGAGLGRTAGSPESAVFQQYLG